MGFVKYEQDGFVGVEAGQYNAHAIISVGIKRIKCRRCKGSRCCS